MTTIEAKLDAKGKKVAIVVSRWNELITKELLAGALDALKQNGDPEVTVVRVPGTWEIPVVCQKIAKKVDAIVALGCIMQGATAHAGLLANDVSSALMKIQVETGTPISWGILTPETTEQALDRAGLKMGNKGREAANAAIEMIGVLGQIKA